MCNAPTASASSIPTGTAGTASLIGSGFAALGGAASSIFAGINQKQQLKLQAYFADLNSSSANNAARDALRRGSFAETRTRLGTAQIKSTQKAAMGANNVDMSEGSALERLVTTDYIGEQDAITIRQNAVAEAADARAQASGYKGQATVSRAAASSINPFIMGISSLATSASEVSRDWYAMREAGVFSKQKKSGGVGRIPTLRGER